MHLTVEEKKKNIARRIGEVSVKKFGYKGFLTSKG